MSRNPLASSPFTVESRTSFFEAEPATEHAPSLSERYDGSAGVQRGSAMPAGAGQSTMLNEIRAALAVIHGSRQPFDTRVSARRDSGGNGVHSSIKQAEHEAPQRNDNARSVAAACAEMPGFEACPENERSEQ